MTETADGGTRKHPRRDELLDEAIELVRAVGPRTSMDDLAAKARVTKPTLYRAFGSKQGLYLAIAEWFISALIADVATQMRSGVPLFEYIPGVIDGVLARIQADVNIYNFLMRRARIELSSDESGADFLGELGDALAALIAEQLSRGGLDPSPAPVWGHGIVGMVVSVADWWVDNQDVERSVVAAEVSSLLVEGFGPMGRGSL